MDLRVSSFVGDVVVDRSLFPLVRFILRVQCCFGFASTALCQVARSMRIV